MHLCVRVRGGQRQVTVFRAGWDLHQPAQFEPTGGRPGGYTNRLVLVPQPAGFTLTGGIIFAGWCKKKLHQPANATTLAGWEKSITLAG